MADRDVTTATTTSRHRGVTASSVLYASLAGVSIGGPLLCITGFIFFMTLGFLLVISPLLIIFSPLLFLAGLAIALSLAGFVIAVVLTVAGVSAIGWAIKTMNGGRGGGVDLGFWGEPVKGVVGQGRDWAEYLQTKVFIA